MPFGIDIDAIKHRAYVVNGALRMSELYALIDRVDLAIAAWPDATSHDRCGTILLKGAGCLANIAITGAVIELKWTAIPCAGVDQAEALRLAILGRQH